MPHNGDKFAYIIRTAVVYCSTVAAVAAVEVVVAATMIIVTGALGIEDEQQELQQWQQE